jgi:hypothetical protein
MQKPFFSLCTVQSVSIESGVQPFLDFRESLPFWANCKVRRMQHAVELSTKYLYGGGWVDDRCHIAMFY